eukprot:8541011-Heterocapsa_arctica.AAC.1
MGLASSPSTYQLDGEDSEEDDDQVLIRQDAENELLAVYSDFVPAFDAADAYDSADESDSSEHSCNLDVVYDACDPYRSVPSTAPELVAGP